MLCRGQGYRTRGLDTSKGKEIIRLGNCCWSQRLKLGCDAVYLTFDHLGISLQTSSQQSGDGLWVTVFVSILAQRTLKIYDWVIL